MKKLLAILTSALLLCAMLPLGAVSVSAAFGGMTYEVKYSAVTITGYTKDLPADLVIPETIEGYPVTTIGEDAFYGCTSLTSVTIPASVSRIEQGAFCDCTALSSVVMEEGVWTIEESAFLRCTALETIVFPNSISSVERNAFYQTAYYNNPENWDQDALYMGRCLIEVRNTFEGAFVIKDGTTCVSGKAFYQCVGLTAVEIPNSVALIEDDAFYGCTALTSIDIPSSVRFIGASAFSGAGLISLVIPGSVERICNSAFYKMPNLTTLIIMKGSMQIDAYAFQECDNLRTAIIGYYGDSDGLIYMSSSDGGTFYSCSNLTKLIIGDGVSSVASYAFWNCNKLTSITFAGSFPSRGEWSFRCEGLTDVYYIGTEKPQLSYSGDVKLIDAKWHLNCINPAYHYDHFVTHSVMDTDNGNGLAFRFELLADGVTMKNRTEADLTNATVNYLGTDCKLVGMGAVITNNAAVGETQFTHADVNDYTVIDIPTVYLQEADGDSCAFAARIIDIPDTAMERTLYARPYYVVEVDGEEITVYGDVDSASCAEYM